MLVHQRVHQQCFHLSKENPFLDAEQKPCPQKGVKLLSWPIHQHQRTRTGYIVAYMFLDIEQKSQHYGFLNALAKIRGHAAACHHRSQNGHCYWLVVWTPLKNISRLGWLFPIYGKIKNGNQTTNQVIISWGIWLSLYRLLDMIVNKLTWTLRSCLPLWSGNMDTDRSKKTLLRSALEAVK